MCTNLIRNGFSLSKEPDSPAEGLLLDILVVCAKCAKDSSDDTTCITSVNVCAVHATTTTLMLTVGHTPGRLLWLVKMPDTGSSPVVVHGAHID
jgi:hypothetical protein